jgi:hypothetical protein
MPYVDAERFQNVLAEYDIPVMPRRIHPHWWGMRHRTSLCRGIEMRKFVGAYSFAELAIYR